MKKYVIVFILFCVVGFTYILLTQKYKDELPAVVANPHFVSIKDKRFSLDGKPFYPVSVNYIVSLKGDSNDIWPSPYVDYNPKFNNQTKDSCLLYLRAELESIKNMGFNSIRVVGIGETSAKDRAKKLQGIRVENGKSDFTLMLSDSSNYKKYFNALQELFDITNEVGLKIVLLIHVDPNLEYTENHLAALASRFKNDPVLMAYDLYNEPLYFDTIQRYKTDVYQITKRWNRILKKNAPNQLSTIGLEGVREVFEWDPNILDVDFLSMHPYEYEPEQVRNETYWYGTYIKKPWIIGETSLPADNDSVSYEEQRLFVKKTLRQVLNCGSWGYTWWQYKDVHWHEFHSDYMGIMSRRGNTKTSINNFSISGIPKPASEEFKKFDYTKKMDSCICLSNYYNYSSLNKFRIIGKLTDAHSGMPIQGGVVMAWDEYWTYSFHTISKADGSFELYSKFPYYHWMASATEYTMVRGNISPDTAKLSDAKIPTINIGNLKLDKVDLRPFE